MRLMGVPAGWINHEKKTVCLTVDSKIAMYVFTIFKWDEFVECAIILVLCRDVSWGRSDTIINAKPQSWYKRR